MLKRGKGNLSGNYKIFETEEFSKKLSKISSRERNLIQKKLKNYIYPQLREEPHFGINIKKLVDYKTETWRYRIGNYRIFYVIDEDDKIVNILTIDSRKDAY